jgi:hypothetical protein
MCNTYHHWYGKNCETSEDDCRLDSGTQLCTNEGDTCVDCARFSNLGAANPECQQGYTCEAAAGPAATTAATFCADFLTACQTWENQEPCAQFIQAAPPGVPGAMDTATQACYISHLGLVATMGLEHCQHADGAPGGPCVDAVAADPCAVNPCQNQGTCSSTATDPTVAGGEYKCMCNTYQHWYGKNCETSEDDCTLDSGTQLCTNEGDTCVDCARFSKLGAANPECQQGYTCEAAAGPAPAPADDKFTGCVDDPGCSENFSPVAEAFDKPEHTGVPCAMWPPADLAVMGLPQGKTMQTYCPTRCQEPQCLGGGGGTTPPAGGDPCTPNPCLNQGQCGTHALDPTIAAGTYKCQCSAAFFGLTCETSEDDCGMGGKVATCGAQACVDCLRGTYQGYTYVPNPTCEEGYSCADGPAPAPVGGGAACTDDPRCGVGATFDPPFAQVTASSSPHRRGRCELTHSVLWRWRLVACTDCVCRCYDCLLRPFWGHNTEREPRPSRMCGHRELT